MAEEKPDASVPEEATAAEAAKGGEDGGAETTDHDGASAQTAANGAGEDPGTGEGSLEEQVEALQAELEQARDAALRSQAEAQNTQRRAEQDVEKARKYALERFCSELLPVVDNLERSLEATGGDDESLKPISEGVELTLKSLLDALRKFNIEPLDPVGEPFDPNLHQAMSMVENPDVEPNSVIAVMQKGYTLHGRLVRPAMVMVSKASGG